VPTTSVSGRCRPDSHRARPDLPPPLCGFLSSTPCSLGSPAAMASPGGVRVGLLNGGSGPSGSAWGPTATRGLRTRSRLAWVWPWTASPAHAWRPVRFLERTDYRVGALATERQPLALGASLAGTGPSCPAVLGGCWCDVAAACGM
jgi:hypothetical protein